jgi:hypothetical protein
MLGQLEHAVAPPHYLLLIEDRAPATVREAVALLADLHGQKGVREAARSARCRPW